MSDSNGGLYTQNRDMLTHWPCIVPTKLNITAWYGRIWHFQNERLSTALSSAAAVSSKSGASVRV
jgi:hypothetical protein